MNGPFIVFPGRLTLFVFLLEQIHHRVKRLFWHSSQIACNTHFTIG